MKTLALTIALLAVPRIARADGWGAGCDEQHTGEDSGGCTADTDGDPEVECSCTTSDPISIGTTLGIVGLVAWRIGRKRRPR